MDRRKALATTGAITLTATAAVVAVGSSIGLFGLTDDGATRIGKLSPVDTTLPARQASVVTTPSTSPATPSPGVAATTPRPTPGGLTTPGTTPSATTNTIPRGDDGFVDHDDRGTGTKDSREDEGEDHDDDGGPGSEDSGHEDDD
jgi:hypothetical protein